MIEEFNEPILPFVKNVPAKTLADDIFPFIPGNKKNMKEWENMMKPMWEKIAEDFKEKGIPMPEVVIDTTPGPITYAIKTVDPSTNI